jgi:hypothetical protein
MLLVKFPILELKFIKKFLTPSYKLLNISAKEKSFICCANLSAPNNSRIFLGKKVIASINTSTPSNIPVIIPLIPPSKAPSSFDTIPPDVSLNPSKAPFTKSNNVIRGSKKENL